MVEDAATKFGLPEIGTGETDENVVVLRAGANASASISLRSSNQIPDFRNAHSIVPGVNALSRARE